MKYTQDEVLFLQNYLLTVSTRLKEKYNLSKLETDKLIKESVFLELMKDDPEFVVNYGINYWVDEIYKNKEAQ